MLVDWAKENTITTGTGTITLSGVTSADFARFQDECNVGDTVAYGIKDGNDREIGVGVLLTATTLARTRILRKLVAGVLTKNPPTGLILSGTAVVYSTAPAEMIGGATPVYGTTPFSVLSRRFNSAAPRLQANSTEVLSANYLYLMPFYLDQGIPLVALAAYVTTGVASANLLLSLYTVMPDFTPGPLLANTAGIPAIAAGLARAVVTQTGINLSPGWYYVGIISDSAITVQSITGPVVSPLGSHNNDPRNVCNALSVAAAYASGSPSPAPASGYTAQMSSNMAAIQIVLEAA